jgi:hypothetical protein
LNSYVLRYRKTLTLSTAGGSDVLTSQVEKDLTNCEAKYPVTNDCADLHEGWGVDICR